MIVEMRTYHLRPGMAGEAERRLAAGLPHREHLSPLGGLWHTVTGQLNTIVHMWPYASVQQRMDVRRDMINPPHWPVPMRELLVEMDSVILTPVAFSPPMQPGRHGNLYEFCIDSYLPGGPAASMEGWAQEIDARTRSSPLVFCGISEFGRLNQVVHIWAYRDAAHREVVQGALEREGQWPPQAGRDYLLRQETFLAAPADCSPLR